MTAAAVLAALDIPAEARTKKGDKYLSQGRQKEARKEWDAALELYEQALSLDPTDPGYQLAADRVRFLSSQAHLQTATKLRRQGQLSEALAEFQKAFGIDPSSSVAEQEIRQTQQMLEREKRKQQEAAPGTPPRTAEERALTPAQEAKMQTQGQIGRMLAVPDLRPLNPQPINLKMNNQAPRVLYETIGKLAGINILFDPDYQPVKNQSIEINNSTLDQALDYLGVLTKSFWKPLSSNTIFITNDNTTKRRDYEEQVMKVFYLTNVNTPQELQEIVTAVRSVADIQRLFVYNAQNAIIARGEADRIALAEKIISDLDKPKPEVVVDVVVMEVNTDYVRKLSAALAPNGLTMPISFTPRTSLATTTTSSSSNSNSSGTGGSSTTGGTSNSGTGTGTGTGTTSSAVALSNIKKITTSDYSVVMPDGLLQALMSDSGTRILQMPQLRSVDNQKASLKIGEKRPTATGSYQPGVAGVGVNALVNTQFTFIDVGVNVDLTPRVHDNGEVSMHVDIEISKVNGDINLGGIDQPIIGQRKVIHDIRMKEGEINLLGGLIQVQQTKSVTGIPGLSSIPLLRRLFTSEDIENATTELVIALIPHIVRKTEITPDNLRGVAVGNATTVKLNYGPTGTTAPVAPAKPAPAAPAPAAPATPAPTAPAPAAPPAATPPATAPPAGAPPATAPPATAPPATAPPAAAPDAGPAPAAPGGPPLVRFNPSQVDTSVNGTVTATLRLENVNDLFAAPLHVKFDPKVLRLNDIVKGPLLSGDGQQIIFTKNILNDSGDATVNLNRLPGSAGVSGTGVAVTLTFQAIGRGATTVSIPQFAPRDSKSQTLFTATPLLVVNVK